MKKIVFLFLFAFSSLFAFEHLSAKNYEQLTKNQDVIIDFYTKTWGACKVLGKNLTEYSKNKPKNIKIYKVDFYKEKELVKKFSIFSYPILVYLRNQKELAKYPGISSPKEIETSVNKHFK